MIQLIVMTDGRASCITQTLASLDTNVSGFIGFRIIHDDSGDPQYSKWLQEAFGDRYSICSHPHRKGFGGSIQCAWNTVESRFVFHLEDDFVFEDRINLNQMALILDYNDDMQQLALKRQPWSAEEIAAGGFMNMRPDTYEDVLDPTGVTITKHRNFFTTNPSLYRKSLTQLGWPTGEHSEGMFGFELFKDPYRYCAFLGSKNDAPRVTHIGESRVGNGY